MRNKIIAFLGTVCMISAMIPAVAQDVAAIAKKYPGESAVVLDKLLHYRIDMRDGKPYVESREIQKLLYLNTNLSYISRYSFHHGSFNEVREYSAYTQTTSNKKIKVTDFQTSHSSAGYVFYDDSKETRFDFPSLAPGATGNLDVKMVHTNPYLLSPYYFSRYIPVIRTELRLTVSNDVQIRYMIRGIDTSIIRYAIDKRRNETTYSFYAEDLKPERRYADAPDVSWYLPHVIFHIDQYRGEDGKMKSYLSNVDDLYRLNYGFISEVNRVPGDELKRTVDSVVAGAKGDREKSDRIYKWVQKHIKYIAFEDGMGGFIPRDANMVLHRRYGDCKDMTSLLTMMLNAAGVRAYFTWIGTRDIAYRYRDVPLPIVDNHMICTARVGDEMIFLDGTDSECSFGTVPSGIQGKEAMVAISRDEYRILEVPVRERIQNQRTDSTVMELDENGIKGQVHLALKGYYASEQHSAIKSITKSDQEEYFKRMFSRGSNKFRLSSFAIEDSAHSGQFRATAGFTLQDYARRAGDEWFINMNLTRPYEGEEIDFPKRKMPVKKEYRFSNRYVVALKIPDGYKVSYVPPNHSFSNDIWGFDLNYRVVNNILMYSLELYNDDLLIESADFENWNKVLEKLSPLYKEIVIISKN